MLVAFALYRAKNIENIGAKPVGQTEFQRLSWLVQTGRLFWRRESSAAIRARILDHQRQLNQFSSEPSPVQLSPVHPRPAQVRPILRCRMQAYP